MLTPQQLQELQSIIDKKITTFIGTNISKDQLTPQEVSILKSSGIDVAKIKPSDMLIYQSFAFGMISGAVPKNVLDGTNYNKFKDYLNSGKMIPLNSYEKAVLSSIERQSLKDIRGIGQRYKSSLEGALNASERKYYEDTLRRNIKEGVAKKTALSTIANDIARELDAFGRDFSKTVDFVSHQAYTEGRTAFFERNYGEDAEIWYQVYDGACSTCISFYLTGGLGSEPKVFKNNQLPPPQINFGKKKEERVTTSSPAHVHCRCHKMIKPSGTIWDEKSGSFIYPEKRKRKVDRKSKVKIEFGEKKYEI